MMLFRRVLFWSLGALFVSVPAGATDATGGLRMWVDHAVFRMSEGSPNGFAEFYFELKRADFEFRPVDGTLRADLHTWVHVRDSAGAPFDSIGGAFIATVADSAELEDTDYTVFFARAIELPPGTYQARLVATDLVDKSASEATIRVAVPHFTGDNLILSDVQLGYDVFEVPPGLTKHSRDVLVKNGYKVYPDCRGLIGVGRSRLFFYLEAYNLAFEPGQNSSYIVEFSIIPTDGSPAKSLGIRTLNKPGRSAILASSVSIKDLSAGLYHLRAELEDPVTHQMAWGEKSFQVVLPPSDTLTDEEIKQLRNIIAYIANPREVTRFESLNSAGKQNFMIQFWKDRDPTPGTPVNEFRNEHLRRMNYANDHYSLGFQGAGTGWQSDQGRVYVIYGPPSTLERYPFAAGRPPAEQWIYDNLPGQGQAYFLFMDERGFGDYTLVHSTARGERRDPYWEDRIKRGEFERNR